MQAGLLLSIVQHLVVRTKEDLLAGSIAARFNSNCASRLVQDLDILMDLCHA